MKKVKLYFATMSELKYYITKCIECKIPHTISPNDYSVTIASKDVSNLTVDVLTHEQADVWELATRLKDQQN